MATDEGADLLWDGEGEQEMMARQLAPHLLFEPLPALVVLATWTMPVTAAAGDDVNLAAVFALVDDRAVGLGSALADGIDDLVVFCGHALAITPEVLGAVGAEEVVDDAHLTGPP